ncbi:uncharacterized protein [Tenebrio molitor]|uniref:uncharacterized protein isoform X2 n=1 Tax=Tenebrio molitor TaxID=7067 RepID=UPI0036249ED0
MTGDVHLFPLFEVCHHIELLTIITMKRSLPSEFDPVGARETVKTNVNHLINSMTPYLNGNMGTVGEGTSKSLNTKMNEIKDEGLDQKRSNFFGKSLVERTYFFTGSPDRLIKWNRIFKHRCFFEVIVSSREGPVNLQVIILLKEKKGPILQVIHYLNHDVIDEDFTVGQTLRCVGYMSGPNTMTAISIRAATAEEVGTLKRYCYIGDFTISGLINAEETMTQT